MLIRDAAAADLPRILDITNEAIRTGIALWTIVPTTLEGRAAWIAERRGAGHPVLVVEQAGTVAGYGSYGPFRPQDGFLHTVEHSLYVDPAFVRRGLGIAMLRALVDHATAAGRHAMIGCIEAGNAASIALHERQGFRAVGTLPQVGRKFDRWLDLVFMHRLLGSD